MSSDVEDDRGGGGGFRMGGGLGLGGTLILLILGAIFHRDFLGLFEGSSPVTGSTTPAASVSSAEDRSAQLASFVLDDVQKTWDKLLPEQAGVNYRHAKLRLYRDYTESACGEAQAAVGPFYCPADERVYLDLGFFDQLRQTFRAPGEFAEAYVIAHEIGHHVQKLLGIESQVRRLQQADPTNANAYSVKLELQADCFAGAWGHSTGERGIIDNTDIADGLRAAASVGDDRIQKMARGRVSPETFTHGSSADRMASFKRGLESGQISACR